MAANEIVLYGTVGASWWDEDFFTAKAVREQLSAMAGDITVRINSGGGIATEGQAIYTMLQDHPGKVTVVVEGVAASAASLIAMAGDEIVMRLGAWMLIHDPATMWTEGRGTEEDHQKTAEMLAVIGNAYADIYAARTGLSRDEAREVMRKETVLDGQMAVDMGFATRVEAGTPAEAAARFDYRIYANAPAELRRASTELGRAPERRAVLAMIAGLSRRKEPTMTEVTSTDVTEATSVTEDTAAPVEGTEDETAKPAPAGDAVAAVKAQERQRASRILDATAAVGLPVAFAQDLIAKGTGLEDALDAITAKWKENGDMDTPMAGRPTARILRDERETRRTAIEAALVAQLGRTAPETDAARPYMGSTLIEMAVEAAGLSGVSLRTADDRDRAIRMATHSTSDFPIIFENALNKRLLDSYNVALPTYRRVAMRADFNDFRPHPIDRVSDFPTLQLVGEGGEIKYGTLGEKKESVVLLSYARALAISRQMIINDDMGAIDRVVASRGRTVAAFEDNTFWAMFLTASGAGPTLTETGRAVFNVTDGTAVASGTAITVDSLGVARASLRKQRTLGGEDLGWQMNRFILLVGPDRETVAQQIVAPIQAAQAGNVNPFGGGMIDVVVTAKIPGNAWYLLSLPEEVPNFMYGFLRGQEGPRMRIDEPFGRQGVGLSVELDFGVGAIDFRGGFRNPGA